MTNQDEVRLRDMVEAAYDAQSFAEGRTREMLDVEKILLLHWLEQSRSWAKPPVE